MDLDLRKLRYFVAVAEQESFVRAADALHIAQPVLSRQIRSLENELKASLFDRDSRGTRLTAAGSALLEEALGLLGAADAAQRRVRDVADGVRRFTVGFTPGVSITSAVREFAARHEDVSVEVLRMEFFHRAESVRQGQVDVGYLRMPADTFGLSLEPLYTEPHVVALPAGHELAGRETVDVADLAAELSLLDLPSVPGSRASLPGTPQEHTGPPVPEARSIEELLEHVAAGRGVVVVPLSIALYFARPDITHVPLQGVTPARVCLAWRDFRRNELVSEYVDIARQAAGQP